MKVLMPLLMATVEVRHNYQNSIQDLSAVNAAFVCCVRNISVNSKFHKCTEAISLLSGQ